AVLEHARMIKDRDEISRIANASKASARIIKNLSISGTESSLAADLDWNIRKSGNKNAFDTIVATGNNIKTPHHTPTNKQLGKTVLIDLGVNYRGYCSDMARTFGSPYEKIVQSVLSDIEEKMAPGVSCSDLDALARKALGKYRKKFITSLGHGVGIAIHEKPSISAASKDILRKGMVIAVEPAIYASNGCRIENTYLITENGCKNLTA
ncbi:MAG: M24 family metallopeptidase, partial [Candidatus Aenigmarchaeota archaeon]|nr:M24 family metallopeptidase [Candidatus Aenigmarchaeota archaeon]